MAALMKMLLRWLGMSQCRGKKENWSLCVKAYSSVNAKPLKLDIGKAMLDRNHSGLEKIWSMHLCITLHCASLSDLISTILLVLLPVIQHCTAHDPPAKCDPRATDSNAFLDFDSCFGVEKTGRVTKHLAGLSMVNRTFWNPSIVIGSLVAQIGAEWPGDEALVWLVVPRRAFPAF